MGKKKKQSTTQTYQPPSWVESGARQAVNIGQRIGRQQYEAYGGERVAGLSRNEQQGIDLARSTTGAALPYYEEAGTFARKGATSWTEADQSAYINPYIKGALDPTAREIRQQGAFALRDIEDKASSTDAWGRRSQLAKADVQERTLQEVSDLYGEGYARAYESGAAIFGEERARDLLTAGRLQEIGTNIQNANQTDIATLMASGAVDRSIRQAMADFDFEQFINERDWDFRNLGGLIASLEGTRGSYTTTTKNVTEKESSSWGAILGIAGTLIGAYFGGPAGAQMGGSIGSSVGGSMD